MGKFTTKSGREIKKTVKEDRGAARRGAAWSAVAALTAGFTSLSNKVAVGAWGHTLAAWSTGGIVYLAADAALSVGETAVNTHKYNKKIKKVVNYLHSMKKADVDLYSLNPSDEKEVEKTLTKPIKGLPVFEAEYGKILRQIYNDFESSPKFDLIRKIMRAKGITDDQIARIKRDVTRHGYVKKSTINNITSRGQNSIANILEVIACDDFSDRIVDIDRDDVSKFKSASHIKGCLALTSEQQTQKHIKLTEEQEFIRKYSGYSKSEFIDWLIKNQELIKNGDFAKLEERQNNFLDKINTRRIRSRKSIGDRLAKGRGIKRAVKRAAKQTPEYQITSWKRNLFPITKLLGTPIKNLVNGIQDRAYYHGDLRKAHKRALKFERKTKLKHADVYCENGTGFRKIRKEYKRIGVEDFIVAYNDRSAVKVPNSFVCGYICDERYFQNTRAAAIKACEQIQKTGYSKQVESRRGVKYVATGYLDDPVVISINGQNFDGDKKQLPLATINVDQRQVLNMTIAGILADLASDDSFQQKVNNITFTAGGRTRTIYIPQIKEDIESFKNGGTASTQSDAFEALQKLVAETHCGKMVEKITRDEPFVRVYKDGILESEPPKKQDEEEIPVEEEPPIEDEEEDRKRKRNKNVFIDLEPEKEDEETADDTPEVPQEDTELNLLLLKRDLLNLKKKEAQRLKFAKEQLALLEEFNKGTNEETKKLEEQSRVALKEENAKLNEEIAKKLKEISEQISFIQQLIDGLEAESQNVGAFIAKLEDDINNNKLESISAVRTKVNDYQEEIEEYYRTHLQVPLVYIENERTGKVSNLYSRLNAEQRKKYSERVTAPRRAEEAKLDKEIAEVEQEIEKKRKDGQINI